MFFSPLEQFEILYVLVPKAACLMYDSNVNFDMTLDVSSISFLYSFFQNDLSFFDLSEDFGEDAFELIWNSLSNLDFEYLFMDNDLYLQENDLGFDVLYEYSGLDLDSEVFYVLLKDFFDSETFDVDALYQNTLELQSDSLSELSDIFQLYFDNSINFGLQESNDTNDSICALCLLYLNLGDFWNYLDQTQYFDYIENYINDTFIDILFDYNEVILFNNVISEYMNSFILDTPLTNIENFVTSTIFFDSLELVEDQLIADFLVLENSVENIDNNDLLFTEIEDDISLVCEDDFIGDLLLIYHTIKFLDLEIIGLDYIHSDNIFEIIFNALGYAFSTKPYTYNIYGNFLYILKYLLISLMHPLFLFVGVISTNLLFTLVFLSILIILMFVMFSLQFFLVPRNTHLLMLYYYSFIKSIIIDLIAHSAGKKYYFQIIAFLFIILNLLNLYGLIPYTFVLTSQFSFTFFCSFIFFTALNFTGITVHGLHLFGLFFPSGAPIFIAPLLIVIEFISYFARVFSLAIRLFANITAGHILLKILSWFTWSMLDMVFASILSTLIISVLWILEFFISVLQAYVFTILVCIYLNDVLNLH